MASIRTKKQQLLAGLLAVVMLLQLAPFAALKAQAYEAAYYIDRESRYVAVSNAQDVSESGADWGMDTATGGKPYYYIAKGEVQISKRVTVTGCVVLILADGCDLKIPQGIRVSEGNTLVICGQNAGTGQLTAGSDDATAMAEGAAGIGGDASIVAEYVNQQSETYNNTTLREWNYDDVVAGTIEIDGGIVYATGGTYGAGIGNGGSDQTNPKDAMSCKVEINGGNVTAAGGAHGAGIGGGTYSGGGTITIRGEDTEVTANGYTGIGGGEEGAAGIITIGGGTVTATGKGINGIGTGALNDTSPDTSCVTIKGGKVTANSNAAGAGIKANTVTIEEGEVIATGINTETGIEGTTIAISGGTVTATSNSTGAGIRSTSGTIAISGGTVTATGGDTGAGISSTSGTITISGGTVTAIGGDTGAGINSTSGTVEIRGGAVTATGSGAGIGGTGGTAVVCGGTVTATATGSGAGISSAFKTTAADGTSGNAFLVASSIRDNGDTTGWSGVIFQGDQGEVYGGSEASPLTLTQSATVPTDATLHIAKDAALRLDDDVQLIVDGELANEGQIVLRPGAYVGSQLGLTQFVDTDDYGMIVEESDPDTSGGSAPASGNTNQPKESGGGALLALLLGGGIAVGAAVYFYAKSLRAPAEEAATGEAAEADAEETETVASDAAA